MRTGLFFVLCAFSAWCVHAQVSARVDTTTVPVNTPFLITVEVSGKDIQDPIMPDVDGLDIEKQPSQTSSRTEVSINVSGSQVLRIRELGYIAKATRTGRVQVPPIAVKVDGTTHSTKSILLNVVDEPKPKIPNPARGRTAPSAGVPHSATPQPDTELSWEDVAFITSTIDKPEVYQGEPVVLRLQLWRILLDGVSVGSVRGADLRYPDAEGFYASALEPEVRREERNGWPYEVSEYRQLLFPTSTGELTIGSWHWQGAARAYTRFGPQRHDYTLETVPITVNVLPLPQRPPEFSGAVGQFQFEAKMGRNDAVQGVPVSLDLKITGQGNPDAIGDPQVVKVDGAYVSDPEKETRVIGEGTVEKVITYAITPLEAGSMTVPEIAFCYFDPVSGTYETQKCGPFTVTVMASAESNRRVLVGDSVPAPEADVEVIGEDILPVLTDVPALRPHRSSVPANIAFGIIPVIVYGMLALWVQRKHRFEQDPAYAREYHALARGRQRFKAIERAPDPGEALFRTLVDFVADKFNVSNAGMTSADAGRLLESNGVDDSLIQTVVRILRACERARYASGSISPAEVRALTEAALPAMEKLNAFKRCSSKGGTP
ncbi:MAG TPA: BatD family protein [Candidatus Hydrogenedentes bacterium]|nr:BatD family protein [Candidatus Hydrogenedentota bacterium]HPG67421.1 BatD family protein [Candidatus Hydrogenedentota bacterium]